MGNFYTDFLVKAPFYKATAKVNDLEYLEPVTRAAVQAIMSESAANGQPLILFETYRSVQRQQFLFKQGATTLQQVGVHHYGLAADLVKDINGQPSWAGEWGFLRDLANKHGLISGLDWGLPQEHHSFVDADHVQRVALKDQAKLFAGAWYPEDKYTPSAPPPVPDPVPEPAVAEATEHVA
jgi:hypothetical protein